MPVLQHGHRFGAADLRLAGIETGVLGIVYAELETDDHVVLHAADLATEGHPLPAKDVLRCLELHAVDRHLLLQAAAVARRVLAEQRVRDADPLVAQHGVEQGARAVFPVRERVSTYTLPYSLIINTNDLHFLVHDDAVALGLVVHAMTHVGHARERSL